MRKWMSGAAALAFACGACAQVQLYTSGGLANFLAGCAPDDQSEVAIDDLNNTAGWLASGPGGALIANSFVVNAGWNVTSFDLFGYQTGAPGASITAATLTIYDNNPALGGVVVGGPYAGGAAVLMQGSGGAGTGVLRVFNGFGCNFDRRVQTVNVQTPGLTLSPGTYWAEWSYTGNAAFSGPWQPNTQELNNNTTTPPGNMWQFFGGAWTQILNGAGNTVESKFDINGFSGPVPLTISYVTAPTQVTAGNTTTVEVSIKPGDDTYVGGSGLLFSRPNGSSTFTSSPLTFVSGTTWSGTLPAFDCADAPEYFAQAAGVATGTVTTSTKSALVTTGTISATFLDVDFEAGLPGGASATGLWNVTSSCTPAAPCDGASVAYYGQTSTCTFNNGAANTGTLSIPLDLSTAGSGSTITLTYCYARDDEGGNPWDLAEVRFNGTPVDTNPPSSPFGFVTRTVDLSGFAGQNGTLEFFYDTVDSVANDFLGWMVDGVLVTGEQLVCEDCYADCDGSGTLNIFDYICFGNAYAAQQAYADCDGSGTFNIFDYICFGNAYAAGCP